MINPATYTQQLHEKTARLEAALSPFAPPPVSVFPSAPSHYRMRAEFKMWQTPEAAHYAMFETHPIKKAVPISQFAAGSHTMNNLMPAVLAGINSNPLLRHRLFEVHFLTSTQGDALVSLLYHKPLNDDWQAAAQRLKDSLGVSLVGRSRGQKRLLGQDAVFERFSVQGREYHYRYSENSFTQPNGALCEQMLNWAASQCQGRGGDLLELYCGNGNFTLPLSQQFDRVLATEIAKVSAQDAHYNIAANRINNIQLVRMSSEELVQALDGSRPFRRLEGIALADYRFSTVFVDPPRSGLDAQTLAFIARFNTIVYISCNLDTLSANLQSLSQSHRLTAAALFDQFPYTHHIESGVVLEAAP